MEKKDIKVKKKRPGRKPGVEVKHGAYSLIVRGTLPRKRKYLESFLIKVRLGLIRDLGPEEEDLTTAQLILIDRVIGKLGVLRCMEEWTRENGVMQGSDLLSPLKKFFLPWSNSLRYDLQALGINKRAAEIIDPVEYIQSQGDKNDKV